MAGIHARVAPSSLARVIQCPGSLKLSEPFLDAPESESAAEGTGAHWVAAEFADGNVISAGTFAPNKIEVDEEMIAGAWLFLEALGGPGMTETAIKVERIHPTECWGTPDFFSIKETRPALLRLVDYKYGHKLIEVWENWQLIAYAIGIMDTYGMRDDEVDLELVIVQPRCFHTDGAIRTWKCKGSDLRPLAIRAEAAVAEALSENATTRVGPECIYCPARHVCATLQRVAFSILDFDGFPQAAELDLVSLGVELRLINEARERLNARATGLAQQAESLIRAGKSVPFFKVAPGRSTTVWTRPPEEIALLGDLSGIELRKPLAVLTPRQAVLVGGLAESAKAAYTEVLPGAMKLVPDKTSTARKIFGHNA